MAGDAGGLIAAVVFVPPFVLAALLAGGLVVLANSLFTDGSADAIRGDTAFAYTAAHESSHTFGLEHTANGDLNNDTRLTTSDIISQFWNSAADIDASADQLANFNMFTRFPLQKGNGAAAGDTYVPFDRLARTVGTPKYGPAYVTGTGAHDRITITKAGRNQATVNVEAFENPDFTSQINATYTYTLRNIANGIIVTAGWGDDLVIIDSRLGEDLEVYGMAGNDKIQVLGLGKAGTGTYNPSGMSETGLDGIESFAGRASASSGGPTRTTIVFRELEPNGWVRFDHFESVTMTTPNATDRLGATVPEAGVTEVFGSSTDTLPLLPIVPMRVNMVRTMVLDTAKWDGLGDSPDDEIRFAASVVQETRIRSGRGNDTIITASGDDVIDAGDGDDFVDAGAGNNRVFGGRGNDRLTSGDGDDRLLGGDGDDTLDGGPGNDILWGGLGDDSLQGGDGNDILVGDSGNDTLRAGSGRDLLIGGRDVDTLFGESDDDILIGGATRYDTNSDALLTILAEWASNRTIDDRIDNLSRRGVGQNNAIRLRRGATVFTDRAQNELWGGSDADWFITMGNDRARDFAPEIDRT
jgi:Ca2+-binding RTX toxin-like protein